MVIDEKHIIPTKNIHDISFQKKEMNGPYKNKGKSNWG